MSFKIIVLGEKGVGRGNLLRDYTEGMFVDKKEEIKRPSMFSGVELFTKNVVVKKGNIGLWFWKLNMQSKFALLNPQKIKQYIKESSGAILIFDTSDYKTLKPLVDYIKIIKETADDIPIILVGNELDFDSSCEISPEDGELFVDNYDLTAYSGICVKSGKNVDNLFEKLAKILNKRYEAQIPLIQEYP